MLINPPMTMEGWTMEGIMQMMTIMRQDEERRRQDEERRRYEEKKEEEKRRREEKKEQEEKEEKRRQQEKAELEILRMQLEQQKKDREDQMEQLKKDREDSERRIMEMANTSQETLKQEYERRKQEKIEEERKAEEQVLPAFLASAAGTRCLQSAMLGGLQISDDEQYFTLRDRWCTDYSSPCPDDISALNQSVWDKPVIHRETSSLIDSFSEDYDKARFRVAPAPHSSDWLLALPIITCGLRLDDEAVRVAVGLRLRE